MADRLASGSEMARLIRKETNPVADALGKRGNYGKRAFGKSNQSIEGWNPVRANRICLVTLLHLIVQACEVCYACQRLWLNSGY